MVRWDAVEFQTKFVVPPREAPVCERAVGASFDIRQFAELLVAEVNGVGAVVLGEEPGPTFVALGDLNQGAPMVRIEVRK